MPRITLWNKDKSNDYNFHDRISGEMTDLGGTGVYIHKYIGTGEGDETVIDDLVFLENRKRKYDDTIYELRGHYNPQDSDFDLSQFGLFLSNDIFFVEFHISNMVKRLGRKLMSGDVLELPHLREFYDLDENKPATNKFFVVEDASKSSSGYGPSWWPHFWRVRVKALTASEEYQDILGASSTGRVLDADGNEVIAEADSGHGSADGTTGLIDIISDKNKQTCITEAIQEEAEGDVKYDPTYFDSYHYYIVKDENGTWIVPWGTGDGEPPNGQEVTGSGDSFPDTLVDGDFYLRTDFDPPALYEKQGSKFKRVEGDLRKEWTGANRTLDKFIDNDETFVDNDCKEEKSRQPLRRAVIPKSGD